MLGGSKFVTHQNQDKLTQVIIIIEKMIKQWTFLWPMTFYQNLMEEVLQYLWTKKG
jgi:hypothetical protein